MRVIAAVCLAAGLALAGCTDDETADGPSGLTRGAQPPPPPLTVSLPAGLDTAVERSGRGPGEATLRGAYGPNYRMFAKCEGDGELIVRSADGGDPWRVPCGDLQYGQQVFTEHRGVEETVTSAASGRWKLVLTRAS